MPCNFYRDLSLNPIRPRRTRVRLLLDYCPKQNHPALGVILFGLAVPIYLANRQAGVAFGQKLAVAPFCLRAGPRGFLCRGNIAPAVRLPFCTNRIILNVPKGTFKIICGPNGIRTRVSRMKT